MYRKELIAAAISLLTTGFAFPGVSLILPQGASLVPKSQWTRQPVNNRTELVLSNQVQGVWGCVVFSQLPPRANQICGYLSIYPTPAPASLRPGYTWVCIPGVNVLPYSIPFNKGTCYPHPSSGTPTRNAIVPKLYQTYEAVIDRQILANVANGQPVYKCVNASGVTVYKVNANSVEIKLKTFIPSQAVSVTQTLPTLVYGGDSRSYSYNDTTFRSFQTVVVNPTQTSPTLVTSRDFGESTQYNPFDARWSSSGRPWWWWDLSQVAQPINRGTQVVNDSTNRITVTRSNGVTRTDFYLRGVNPLNLAAPPIDINLTVNVRRTSTGTTQYSVTGGHDGFPSYELYVNGDRVYNYDPQSRNKSPLDLVGGPDEISVNTGWRNASCPGR